MKEIRKTILIAETSEGVFERFQFSSYDEAVSFINNKRPISSQIHEEIEVDEYDQATAEELEEEREVDHSFYASGSW